MNNIRTSIIAISSIGVVIVVILVTLGLSSHRLAQDGTSTSEPLSESIARKPCDFGSDLNQDGKCDNDDTKLFLRALGACKGTDTYDELFDADHDGCVTANDQEKLFPIFVRKSGPPCDLDFDGDCDREDYRIFMESIRTCYKEPIRSDRFRRKYNPLADANRNGCVLGDDEHDLFPVIPEN